jgi:hypothetical protein
MCDLQGSVQTRRLVLAVTGSYRVTVSDVKCSDMESEQVGLPVCQMTRASPCMITRRCCCTHCSDSDVFRLETSEFHWASRLED